jgi:hypothetical protein
MHEQAEAYCRLIEDAESLGRESFALQVAASLAGLNHAATQLPDVSPTASELAEGPTHEQWEERFNAIRAVLGDWSGYWITTGIDSDEAVLRWLAASRRSRRHLA